MNDTELIVSWSYIHTGGLSIIHTQVQYRNDSNETFLPIYTSSGSGSLQSSGSGSEVQDNSLATSVSLPLPVAGVTYFFRVTASNEYGSSSTDCASIFLTTGICNTIIVHIITHNCLLGIPSVPEFSKVFCSAGELKINVSTNYSGVSNVTRDNFHFILNVSL